MEETIIRIPENAQVILGPDRGTNLLDGTSFTFWPADDE